MHSAFYYPVYLKGSGGRSESLVNFLQRSHRTLYCFQQRVSISFSYYSNYLVSQVNHRKWRKREWSLLITKTEISYMQIEWQFWNMTSCRTNISNVRNDWSFGSTSWKGGLPHLSGERLDRTKWHLHNWRSRVSVDEKFLLKEPRMHKDKIGNKINCVVLWNKSSWKPHRNITYVIGDPYSEQDCEGFQVLPGLTFYGRSSVRKRAYERQGNVGEKAQHAESRSISDP